MLRGILTTLSSRVSSRLGLFPSISGNGAFSFVSKTLINQRNSSFCILAPRTQFPSLDIYTSTKRIFLEPPPVHPEQKRTVIKFSYKKGKRKTVHAVIHRFFRLHWGGWIRPIAGRKKKLWKKSAAKRNYYSNHLLCNLTQCKMLDKMVNKFWRKPKYYIEDPYEPYHKRHFDKMKGKPWRPEGVDYE